MIELKVFVYDTQNKLPDPIYLSHMSINLSYWNPNSNSFNKAPVRKHINKDRHPQACKPAEWIHEINLLTSGMITVNVMLTYLNVKAPVQKHINKDRHPQACKPTGWNHEINLLTSGMITVNAMLTYLNVMSKM